MKYTGTGIPRPATVPHGRRSMNVEGQSAAAVALPLLTAIPVVFYHSLCSLTRR